MEEIKEAAEEGTENTEARYIDYRRAFTLTEEAFFRQRRELGTGTPLLSIVAEGSWPGLQEALAGQSCLRFEVLTKEPLGLPGERVLAHTTLHERGLLAAGPGVTFLPEGGIPGREWVYHLVKALLQGAELVYTDEVIITDSRVHRLAFKPGFHFLSLLGRNILGRSVAIHKKLYRSCGGYREDSSEGWYDCLLRCGAQTGAVTHIPLVLLQLPEEMPPQNPWPVEKALSRGGLWGVVGKGTIPGTFLPKFFVKGMPLVSLLVRARGEVQPLKTLLEWVEKRSVYPKYEWVISCPRGVDETMEKYLQALKDTGAARIYREEGALPACLNRCAWEAKGTYLLFMEEGCLPLTADFIGRLLEWAMLPQAGTVGGRHCPGERLSLLPGQLPGLKPVAVGKEEWVWTEVPRAVSCLPLGGAMVQRERFWAAGGLEAGTGQGCMEAFSLTLGRQGYGAMYCPQARFLVPAFATVPLSAGCREIFQSLLQQGDPMFNPNLSHAGPHLHLALPPVPPGEEME